MIEQSIQELIQYGIAKELVTEEDSIFLRNQLMDLLRLSSWETPALPEVLPSIDEILDKLVSYATENGIIADSNAARDLFDTRIMGLLTDMPHTVNRAFFTAYHKSPEEATDWYYQYSKDTNYVRAGRIAKDMRWTYDCDYGTLDITINRSKPEKDPRDIAAAKNQPQTKYPACQLCIENTGFAGTLTHPARQNLRPIPIQVHGEPWAFQYSPYGYYNEHCIVFNQKHIPMVIDAAVFEKLFDILDMFPHYFIGSNADLPIVGGSILSHEHFQGGHYTFAMAKAPIETPFLLPNQPEVQAGIVKWPMSVLRTRAKDPDRLIELGDQVLGCWRGYTDEAAFIFAETDGEPHNTITPIARKNGDMFELDLVLRNNITTEEFPMGVYHPHQELHHIKKENIGLIEVMGLAVLPSRLKGELAKLGEYMVSGKDIRSDAEIEKHADWVEEFLPKYPSVTAENVDEILKQEVGLVFEKVLEDAGVYKCTKEGREAFAQFLHTVGFKER